MRQSSSGAVREGHVQLNGARLYYRDLGRGQPILVLHGGPDFDHQYLLPEMDGLSSSCRLIYYDQRGRGKSATGVLPDQVSMSSEVADLEAVREHFGLDAPAILGHSWGGLLALEYVTRHPDRVSRLILLNTAPASHADFQQLRADRRRTAADDLQAMQVLSATTRYREGDLATEAEYYRRHFRTTLREPEQLERVVQRLRTGWTPAGILKARAIEQRLYDQTWFASDYSLLPSLGRLAVPTLVLHGEHDLIPVACAAHIAEAIPGARLAVLKECGHFGFVERPAEVHQAIADFCA